MALRLRWFRKTLSPCSIGSILRKPDLAVENQFRRRLGEGVRFAKYPVFLLLAALLIAQETSSAQTTPPPMRGDVYASSQTNGDVDRFSPNGPLVQTLSTGTTDGLAGSVFDDTGNFYVTDFTGAELFKFDPEGKLIAALQKNFPNPPESVVLDSKGHIFVGQATPKQGDHSTTGNLVELDASGNVLATFSPTLENRGTDWIDLATDQCTMFYTSEGHKVMRFNVCTNQQMPDFAVGLPGPFAYALRIRPNGEVIVADSDRIVRLSADGKVVQTYGLNLEQQFFATNLDPDGTSFWSADLNNGNIYRFDIASGNLINKITAENMFFAGLTIFGQITVGTKNPPTCNFSVDHNSGQAPFTINATASCQPGTNGGSLTIATLDWGDGSPQVQISCDGNCPPGSPFTGSHTYMTANMFTASISTTDSNQMKGSASQTITVTSVDSTPKCTIGSDRSNGPAPLTVVFNGSCTDAGNDLGEGSTGTLNFGDNTSQPVSAASFSNVSHQYANAVTFQVTYTSTDASKHTGTATETITVTQPVNSTPSCMLASDKSSGAAPLTVVFQGSCTDAGDDLGQGSTGTLNFGDNTSQPVSAASFSNVSHQYANFGTFQVTYTSTDATKHTGTATETITVSKPVDSTPMCTLAADKTTGQAPLMVVFQGSCTDAGNDLGQGSSASIDFGDKSSQPVSASSFSNVSHQYANAGTFAVVYSVTDAAGLKGSATQTIMVSTPSTPSPFSPNVFVGVSGGNVQEYAPDGSLVATHTTGLGGTVAGIAFDKANNLYAVDLTAANVSKFDPSGKLIGTFGGGYNCQPEMIVFDGAGDAYVGQQGCSHQILKFDSNGTLLQQFQVATENTGSDDLALSADECTMLYTSEGPSVLRFDVCKGQQLSPFATGLKKALVPRILPDGSVLVSEVSDIVRLSPTGQPMQHYTAPGEQCWYALAVDQHGSSFWAADFCSSNIHQFDLASGNELAKFNTGTANGTVFGLGMAGSGLNVAGVGNAGTITASPQSATVTAGQPATFTVTLAADPQAAGLTFTLSCAGLPAGGSCAFSPPSVEAQGSAVTSNLTIATGGMVAASHHETRWIFASLISIFPAFVLLGTAGPRRRRVFFITLAIICLTGLMSIGCSGGRLSGNQNSTPVSSRGAFNVIVVGTSGQMQVSTTVQLNVQ